MQDMEECEVLSLENVKDKVFWVSGSAGFIGSKVSELILSYEGKVVGVDNINNYYSPSLKLWRLNQLKKYKNFRFYKGDIEYFSFVENTMKDVDCVIHLAARAGVRASMSNPWGYVNTNILGTVNVLESMRKHDIINGAFASSSSVYAGSEIPFVEDNVRDKPLNVYASSKRAIELISYNYYFLYGIGTKLLRYFTVYGPAGRPDMAIFKFINNILLNKELVVYGDGKQRRDFTYVDDASLATIKSLGVKGYDIFNIGNDNPVELNYVISLIEKYTKKKARIKYIAREKADMKDTWANIDKAKRILSWEPSVSIDEGIKRTVEWMNFWIKENN